MNEGYLSLRLAKSGGGATRLAGRRQTYPLTTTVVLPLEGEDTALIYVQNAAGSVFGGDKLSLDIKIDQGAELCLSTPAATRVHGEKPSLQETDIHVEENGFVEVIPDMLIPHEGANHQQITRLSMEKGAGAIVMDAMAPGRLARGEKYKYTRLSSRLIVTWDGRKVLIDGASFRPSEVDPESAGALGSEGYVGSLFAICAPGDHSCLAAEIADSLDRVDGVFGGAATLSSGYGVVARFLAPDTPSLRKASYAAWDSARKKMRNRNAPVLRK